MVPSRDRIPWDMLKREYPKWREQGSWISTYWWFGFDVTHSWTVGTERLLMAMAMEPEWCVDMFNTCLDLDIALFEMAWDEGYTFDEIHWPDDMGYKGTQFFSLDMYRNLLKPVHKRACDWAHAKGIKAHLHSCGNIGRLVPDLIDAGHRHAQPHRGQGRQSTLRRSKRSTATGSPSTAASTRSTSATARRSPKR